MIERVLKAGDKFGALTLKYYDSYLKCWICSCDCGKQNVKAERKSLLKELYPCCGKCRRLGTWALQSAAVREAREKRQHQNNNNKYYITINSQGKFKSSVSEKKIYDLLTEFRIPFECEKGFGACYPESMTPFRFDFFVDNRYLIEFDGEQHFHAIKKFGGKEKLQEQKRRDWYKNKWCHENNIPLIRIPYFALESITIKDLKLETSIWIIKPNKI